MEIGALFYTSLHVLELPFLPKQLNSRRSTEAVVSLGLWAKKAKKNAFSTSCFYNGLQIKGLKNQKRILDQYQAIFPMKSKMPNKCSKIGSVTYILFGVADPLLRGTYLHLQDR